MNSFNNPENTAVEPRVTSPSKSNIIIATLLVAALAASTGSNKAEADNSQSLNNPNAPRFVSTSVAGSVINDAAVSNGTIYFVGETTESGYPAPMLGKVDANGKVISGIISNSDKGSATGIAIVDSKIYTTGYTENGDVAGRDIFVAKSTETNTPNEGFRYDGGAILGGSKDDISTDIVNKNGNLIITGSTNSKDFPGTNDSNINPNYDYATRGVVVELNSNLETESTRFTFKGVSDTKEFIILNGEKVFVGGNSTENSMPSSSVNGTVTSLDSNTLEINNEFIITDGNNYKVHLSGMTETPDGLTYIVGSSIGLENPRSFFRIIDKKGNTVTNTILGFTPVGIVQDEFGNAIVGGTIIDSLDPNITHPAVYIFDKNGNPVAVSKVEGLKNCKIKNVFYKNGEIILSGQQGIEQQDKPVGFMSVFEFNSNQVNLPIIFK